MALNPASCLGVAGSATLELSPESLQVSGETSESLSLLSQIETELYHSEVYRRCLNNLRLMLGETTGNAQMLMKAIGREAIRLSLQQCVQQQPIAASEPSHQPPTKEKESTQHSLATTLTAKTAQPPSPPPAIKIAPSTTIFDAPIAKSQKKLTKAQLASQKAEQDRHECLRKIGEQLRQARQKRSLSMAQLHSQTLIPPHQLEALESGRVEQLPEDIYVRGFIRRIAEVLKVDAASLLDALPAPDPVKSVVPSWYRPATGSSGMYLSTAHLYVSYTALIAGAVGGLTWLSGQSAPNANYEVEPIVPTDSSVTQSARQMSSTNTPGLKSTPSGVVAGPDLAPPEALSNF